MLDVGGESTRPGAAPVGRGRGARPRGPGDRRRCARESARPDLHRHHEARRRPRRRRGGRARCGTTSPPCAAPGQPGDRRRARLRGGADAHAGRARDHAGRRRATTTWWREVAAFLAAPRRGGHGRGRGARADLARSRASASARPPAHNLPLIARPGPARRAGLSGRCWAPAASASSRIDPAAVAGDRLGGSLAAALAGARGGRGHGAGARRARDRAGASRVDARDRGGAR